MARELGRYIAKHGDFKDLSVGIEFYEEGGLLFARMSFSATYDHKRKTTRLNVDLNEALKQFTQRLPQEGKEKPLEAPIPVTAADDGSR